MFIILCLLHTLTFHYFVNQFHLVISHSLSNKILQMYFRGLEDYSVDHRGDVGSWIREASMQGLRTMVPIVARLDHHLSPSQANQRYLSDKDHTQVLAKLLQQSVEKIDRIRGAAATAMVAILYAEVDPEAEAVPAVVGGKGEGKEKKG